MALNGMALTLDVCYPHNWALSPNKCAPCCTSLPSPDSNSLLDFPSYSSARGVHFLPVGSEGASMNSLVRFSKQTLGGSIHSIVRCIKSTLAAYVVRTKIILCPMREIFVTRVDTTPRASLYGRP